MKKNLISFSIFFLLFLGGVFPSQGMAEDSIAIIVNRSNSLDSVSFHELVQIFKQEKQFWPGSQKIYLLIMGSPQEGKDKMLSNVYQMSDDELKKFWISKLYRGEITETPKVILTPDSMKKFVGSVSNAIGFVRASDVDPSVKILKIDGKGPHDAGYPLK